ncbi:hypothetical protein AtubIFM57258_010400 [Aspergillus tubingensis]|nr:hypothetical protein AtubIFM57258_010400 [Aspergillus tubingensis]
MIFTTPASVGTVWEDVATARLIFTFTYIPEERQSKSRVRDWLAKNNFELQGRLCGVRAKNERLLDIAYFVKNNIFALPYR